MKNSRTIIGALSFILLVTFGCKKEKEAKLDTKEQFSVAMQKSSFKGENENAIVVGSKSELEALFSGKKDRVFLKKASEKNNLFRPVVGTTGPVVDPEPIDFCWEEINTYYNEHIQSWQAIANETCKPYVTCITCPNSGGGLYVMYAIQPKGKNCLIYEQASIMYNFTPFNFTVNQYDTEAVSSVINPKR
ncbi:hypothetical protein [Pedobacter arcticus]|uniref:hypothetical protein n=1 Tax=Pedobacter arcticus TaxID=752140 RepID=UPI0002FA9498|nr:hypothetical protein [Pedobacter arcticus]